MLSLLLMVGRRKQQCDEFREQGRFQDNRSAKADHGTQEMGIMANVVELLPAHVKRIVKVEHAKNDSWHWQYSKEIDILPGVEKDGCKQYGGDSTGCPYGIVIYVVAVLDK
jgi:hypothetical protein